MKSIWLCYVLPPVAVLLVAFGYDQSTGKNTLCKQQYALCTSARCIPQPDDPTKAICLCDVEEGASMSTVPCNTLRPSTDENGLRTIYSTFSLKQFTQGKRSMKCPDGTPWTWCLNKRCTVDPANPQRAICICDVKRTGEWTTLGGNCNTATCETSYWSGATLDDSNQGNAFLTKALGLDQSPAKWCPAVSP